MNVKISLKKRNVDYMKEHMGDMERGRREFGKKSSPYDTYYQEANNHHATYAEEQKNKN